MAGERCDTKNRILWKGEYQKKIDRYVDSTGISRFVYGWTLTRTDRPPKGKRIGKCLRELESDIAKDSQDEIDIYSSKKLTLNSLFGNYILQKKELKSTTRVHYKYLYKLYVKDYIGNIKINIIKYSDIKKYYNTLTNNMLQYMEIF